MGLGQNFIAAAADKMVNEDRWTDEQMDAWMFGFRERKRIMEMDTEPISKPMVSMVANARHGGQKQRTFTTQDKAKRKVTFEEAEAKLKTFFLVLENSCELESKIRRSLSETK